MTRARDVANLIGSGNFSSTTFTATAGQTAFTISHTQGFIQVFMNGLLLDETVDYTSNGSAVTLTSGAAAGDEIEVVAYNTFSVGDALNQAAADTRYVNTTGDTMSGTLNVNGGNFNLAPDDAAAHRYMFLNTGASQDGHIVLQRALANKYQITAKTDNSYSIYGYPASGEVFNINSSGHVTKPKQPVFNAHYASNDTFVVADTKFPFNATTVNLGSHFDTSNNRFVAPTAGYYLFTWGGSIAMSGNDDYITSYLRKNGSNAGGARARTNSTHGSGTKYESHAGAAIHYMAVNDYMEVWHYGSTNGNSYTLGSEFAFCGTLVN